MAKEDMVSIPSCITKCNAMEEKCAMEEECVTPSSEEGCVALARSEELHRWAREKSAQCWCDSRVSDQTMDTEMAEVFADKIREAVVESNDALILRLHKAQEGKKEAEHQSSYWRTHGEESYKIIEEALGKDMVVGNNHIANPIISYMSSIKNLQEANKKLQETNKAIGETYKCRHHDLDGIVIDDKDKCIHSALKALSGDLSYDNVAQAKKILTEIIMPKLKAPKLRSTLQEEIKASRCSACNCDCTGCGCRSGCCTKCGCCNG